MLGPLTSCKDARTFQMREEEDWIFFSEGRSLVWWGWLQGRHDQIKFKFVGMFRSHLFILPFLPPTRSIFPNPNITNKPSLEVPIITIKHRQESNPKSTDSRDKKCQTNARELTHPPPHTLAPISL
jgi:hypothetical protein